MSYSICDSQGWVADIASGSGWSDFSNAIALIEAPLAKQLILEGHSNSPRELAMELQNLTLFNESADSVKEALTVAATDCQDCVILTDNVGIDALKLSDALPLTLDDAGENAVATNGSWITVHGAHIFVKDGVDIHDAIKEHFKNKINNVSSWVSKNKAHPKLEEKKAELAKHKEQWNKYKKVGVGEQPIAAVTQDKATDTGSQASITEKAIIALSYSRLNPHVALTMPTISPSHEINHFTFTELCSIPAAEKLKLYAALSAEMIRCGLTRTQNNPVGDVAETLFCRALGLSKNDNKSSSHVDAIGCNDDLRYQIKGRRLVGSNGARQLGALRDLDGDHFDFLGAVLFNDDFTVRRAAVIPVDVVRNLSRPDKHTRSSRFILTDAMWEDPQVWDVTNKLRAVDLDAPLTEQALKSAASLWYGERHQ